MLLEKQDRLENRIRYEQLRESRFFSKITRYAIGSLVALGTSIVVFAVLLNAGVSTTLCTIAAFIAGAIPNWILNRRWAWQKTDKVDVAREVVGYLIVSIVSLVAAAAATGWMQHWVRSTHVQHGLHTILITGAYVAVQALLFVVKFVIYDRWIFTGRSRLRAALRSRHQVWTAARANRTP